MIRIIYVVGVGWTEFAGRTMQRKMMFAAIVLVVLIVVSFFVVFSNVFVPVKQTSPLFAGVEVGWDSNVSDCKVLIDRVKGYTNLLVIASPLILSDEELLNETCDYAYNSGMSIIVYFDDLVYSPFFPGMNNHYTPSSWFTTAKERYGDRLLGIYYNDEPAGRLLDQRVDYAFNYASNGSSPPNSYVDLANQFLNVHNTQNAASLTKGLSASLFTSDYALYWFDYEAGYDTVFAELGWNNSRQMQIALTRGAATAQDKDWGAIITWTYNQSPYLENGSQLYDDLVLSYDSGAKYIVVYDSSQGYLNTTLTGEHFDALKRFWSYTQQNPRTKGNTDATTALVLPQDYGFGFRNPDDSVWGVKQTDNWTRKMFADITNFLNENSNADIVYADAAFQNAIQSKYSNILYWPKDFETNTSYPVVNLDSGLGYDTVQEAISSYATSAGDTILVKPGTYKENITITKPVVLLSKDKDNAIVDGARNRTAITIACDNVTVNGFKVQNGGNFSAGTGEAILLDNAHNCSLIGNTVTNSNDGILMIDSSNNLLRNNSISNNKLNFGVSASNPTDYVNDIDTSNTINGKPIIYWIDKNNAAVPSDAGFIGLINCANITVQNFDIAENYEGLLLVNAKTSTISNNEVHDNFEGIIIDNSRDNVLKNNDIKNNRLNFDAQNPLPNDIDASNLVDGKPICYWIDRRNETVPSNSGYVALINCSDITVENLQLANNGQGVVLVGTSNSTVINNDIKNAKDGIELIETSNVTITKNQISNNTISGISVTESSGNVFTRNNLSENDKAIYLSASSNNTISNNNISTNNYGIWLENNTVSNATENIIFSNAIAENTFGIDIELGAENNTILHNNFLNNTMQVSGYGMPRANGGFGSLTLLLRNMPMNSWDNASSGNYWSDYTGTDANHDGIGDDHTPSTMQT